MHSGPRTTGDERPADVVRVAHVGQHPSRERTQVLTECEQVSHRLSRMLSVREEVDHRDGGASGIECPGHPLERRMPLHPSSDHRVVAPKRARDVLCGLAFVDPDFLTTDRHGVAAELGDRELAGVACAGGRVFEHESHSKASEHVRRCSVPGELEHAVQLFGAEVGHRKEMASHESTSRKIATASSISSPDTVSGGANLSTYAAGALITRP